MASPHRIQLLDGGMGTTLESEGHNVSTALWGCDLLLDDPEAIKNIHKGFVQSGADMIETATYQLTLDELCRHAKLTTDVGGQVMRRSIELAAEAVGDKQVVLSIGPFGATLCPGQEYAGIYPRPYGPVQPPTSSPSSSAISIPPSSVLDTPAARISIHTNAFDDPIQEEQAISALTKFHFDRLSVFSSDPHIWSSVSWLAFETVPVTHEIKAIRRAMGQLRASGRGKKFWISSAYPDGSHPQDQPPAGTSTSKVEVNTVLSTMIASSSDAYPPADGVGINCTNPQYLDSLITEFSAAYRSLRKSGDNAPRPVFVLYPDGGSVYNTVTRTWSSGKVDAGIWAASLANLARRLDGETDGEVKLWAGVIVGGCCKAGFEEISALRKASDVSSKST